MMELRTGQFEIQDIFGPLFHYTSQLGKSGCGSLDDP